MAAPLVSPAPVVTVDIDGSKIHQVSGHKFKAAALRQPTFCSQCSKFIFGIGKQGYKCLGCDSVVHKRCHSVVEANCVCNPPVPTEGPAEEGVQVDSTHEFNGRCFTRPTCCDHCGTLIYGLVKQGVRCDHCHKTMHWRCKEKCMHSCGN